jgi:hypothetical protein
LEVKIFIPLIYVRQYKREPLNDDEANRPINAYEVFEEKLVNWTLIDTGFRATEQANSPALKRDAFSGWSEGSPSIEKGDALASPNFFLPLILSRLKELLNNL